jgi:hypothetical protein
MTVEINSLISGVGCYVSGGRAHEDKYSRPEALELTEVKLLYGCQK